MIDCSRCGAQRQTRLPCPECGLRPPPTEVDVNLQDRRAAVKPAQLARKAETLPVSLNAQELLTSGRLEELAERIYASADKIGRRDAAGTARFAELAGEIASLERWTHDVERLRPWIFLTDAVKTVVAELIKVFDTMLRAITSEEIRAAQSCEAEAQAALDRAAEAMSDANDRLELLLSVFGGDDPIGAWIAVGIAGDPSTVRQRGQDQFLHRTGLPCGISAGLTSLIMAPLAATIGDEDRWWDLVSRHIRFLDDKRSAIGRVLQDPSYAARRSEVVQDLWQHARRAVRMQTAETTRQEAADLLDLGHLVIEQQLKFNLGFGCALTTRRSFAATQGSDVTALASIAREQDWPIASHLGDSRIRNAFAHRDFRIDGDLIVLSPHRSGSASSRQSLKMPELLNAVLEIIEISAAMELATLWIIEQTDPDSVFVAQGIEFVEAILTCLGCSDIRVTNEVDNRVRISASVDPPVPLATIAAAAHPVAETAKVVFLHLQSKDKSRECTVMLPTDTFAIWQSTKSEIERESAFMHLCEATTVDGVPILSRAHIRHMVSFRACQLFLDKERELADICADLVVWRSLAATLALDDLARDIGRAIKCRRYRAAGLQVTEADVPALLEHVVEDLPLPITDLLA